MNTPKVTDFIAEAIGHRNWYTRPKAAPAKARGKTYINPKAFSQIMADYADLFGVDPRTGFAA